MQVIAQIFFKTGSLHPDKWLLFFILGNVFGASSIWFLMMLYKNMNVNIALALATGGSFLLTQIVLSFVFRSSFNWIQIVGILGIAVCMILVVLQ